MADDGGKFRESIWSIHPKWRGWFYGVLSACGVAVSAFTLYDEWSNGWLEIFNAIRDGIVSSVVVVWFVFQVMESAMGAYQYFTDLREAHRQEREARLREEIAQMRKEAEEKARKEAEAYQKRYNEELLKQGVTEEQIRQAYQLSGPFPPSMM